MLQLLIVGLVEVKRSSGGACGWLCKQVFFTHLECGPFQATNVGSAVCGNCA